MVHAVETQPDGLQLVQLGVCFAQISGFDHLVQYHVAPLTATLRFPHRIEIRRVFTHSYKRRRFANREVLRFFVEVCAGCRLDAHGIMQEIEVIEVHGDDFLFGIVSFQLDCNHPLYGFLQGALHRTLCHVAIKLLGQLLGNGTSSPGIALSE